jgi:glucosamine--fructose-6-phosphate aminotransferase (isomerizing)
VVDKNGNNVNKHLQKAPFDAESAEKSGYAHFMRKEISEEKFIVSRLFCTYADCHGIPDFKLDEDEIKGITHVTVVGCGTAYHAGLYLKMLFESVLRLRVDAAIASEFRYSSPILDERELVIFISQSGETADTLTALRNVKNIGIKTVGIVNVVDSAIAVEADRVIYTHAGAEIAVASTKAYSAQCTVCALLTAYFARVRGALDKGQLSSLCRAIKDLPERIGSIYKEEEAIREAAELIKDAEHLFFIGRRGDHIAAIEGSLKLKEITYIHSECYPSGELKHGTISLITENTPVVAIFGAKELKEKSLSNLKEVASRGARIIAVSERDKDIAEVSDFMLNVPPCPEELFPIMCATLLQLLAYHTAVLRGCDVDQPRNLAKSVTVE